MAFRQEVFGPYVLVEQLAVGSVGEVLRATSRSGQPLALKRLLPSSAQDPLVVSAFEAETVLAGAFDHEGIPKLVDVGSVDGVAYAAYELVSGRDLRTVLEPLRKIGKRLPVEVAVGIVTRVADALGHVHDRRDASGAPLRIVHRDVSPANILLSFEGGVKLVDFGIARSTVRAVMTARGEVRGTLRYVSPEQVEQAELDARSDLFSLGLVLWELLLGRPALEGPTENVIARIARGDIAAPRDVDPTVPEALDLVVRKVLAKSREERYPSASVFSEALTAASHRATPPLQSGVGTPFAARLAEVMSELFAGELSSARSQESQMADDKGSDLDVFEGLAKKSSRPSQLASSGLGAGAAPPPPPSTTAPASQAPSGGPSSGGPVSHRAPPPPPPSSVRAPGVGKTTLLGVPAPAPPSQVDAPTSQRPPPPPPPSRQPSRPPVAPSSPAPAPPVGASAGSGPPPMPGATSATTTPAPLPPPPSRKATLTGTPSPLAAGTPPAPLPPPPAGSPASMGPSSVGPAALPPPPPPSKVAPPVALPPPPQKDPPAAAAGVDMDWDDEEESTHVFEKRKHAMAEKAKAKGVGSAAALVASSGQRASNAPPSSTPAPPAVSTGSVPPPPPVPERPFNSEGAASARRPSEEATVVRPRERDASGRAGVVLGGLALVAVGGLAAFLLWPRTGQLKIDLKAKDGQAIPRAEIFVDGVKRCEASPCVVADLSPGAKTIRVIPPGQTFVDAVETVEAGKEKLVFISVGAASSTPGTKDPVATGGTGFKVAGSQPGVKVFVDGTEKGGLPLSLSDLTPGEHKLKFDGGDRYKPEERTITIGGGEQKDLGEVRLKVVKGIVTLDLRTEGANVLLSGTAEGKKVEKKLPDSIWKSPPVRLPINLEKEQWTLVASKKGLAEFRRELDFADGNPEPTIVIELGSDASAAPATTAVVGGPLPTGPATGAPPKDPGKTPPEKDPKDQATGQGTLNINSIPVSKVLLDGRPIGSTPKLGVSVSAGTHTVTFIKDGERKSVSVTVKAGETKVASVKF